MLLSAKTLVIVALFLEKLFEVYFAVDNLLKGSICPSAEKGYIVINEGLGSFKINSMRDEKNSDNNDCSN